MTFLQCTLVISACCLTHAPLCMLNSFAVPFNQVWSKQVWGTAARRHCLSLTSLLWRSQSHHLRNPPAWLAVHCFGPKLEPLGPIFGRKLFFIAPKTPQLLPVWPSPFHTSLQVIRPSFLLLMRGRLRGQVFKKTGHNLGFGPLPLCGSCAFFPSTQQCHGIFHL